MHYFSYHSKIICSFHALFSLAALTSVYYFYAIGLLVAITAICFFKCIIFNSCFNNYLLLPCTTFPHCSNNYMSFHIILFSCSNNSLILSCIIYPYSKNVSFTLSIDSLLLSYYLCLSYYLRHKKLIWKTFLFQGKIHSVLNSHILLSHQIKHWGISFNTDKYKGLQ